MYTHNASYMKKKIFIISSLTSFSTAVRKNTCQKYFLCPLRPNIIIPTATSYSYIVCSYYVVAYVTSKPANSNLENGAPPCTT